mmetsp:Transcript_105078/g.322078  ORF Transcript_105078/g.322078 Transcript_105078/m.322078 type:complete len:242 (+) Transcript_105078:108-833(+)
MLLRFGKALSLPLLLPALHLSWKAQVAELARNAALTTILEYEGAWLAIAGCVQRGAVRGQLLRAQDRLHKGLHGATLRNLLPPLNGCLLPILLAALLFPWKAQVAEFAVHARLATAFEYKGARLAQARSVPGGAHGGHRPRAQRGLRDGLPRRQLALEIDDVGRGRLRIGPRGGLGGGAAAGRARARCNACCASTVNWFGSVVRKGVDIQGHLYREHRRRLQRCRRTSQQSWQLHANGVGG